MALSYSNIEACLVKPMLEDTAKNQDDKSDAASKKPPAPWHLIPPALHIISFAVIIWLVVQVLHLQNELVQLHSDNFRQSSIIVSSNSSDQSVNHTKSNQGARIRRQAVDSQSMSSSSVDYSNNDGQGNCCNGVPSFHVTGIQQPESTPQNWFTFHTSTDAVYSRYSHENLQFVHNKFFEVLEPGYYFVYSQICYEVNGPYTYGHEVVVLPNCGDGDSFTILRAKATQRTQENRSSQLENTGYAGGVFYLTTNDRLGIRPLQDQSFSLDYQDSIAQSSYFGAFLLARDMNVQVDPDLSPCT